MQGEWRDVEVPEFQDSKVPWGERKLPRSISARGYFRLRALADLPQRRSSSQNMYRADFIYVPEDDRILKNRHGSVEALFENAQRYMSLRHHPNESVRRLIEKAETLAALTENTI